MGLGDDIWIDVVADLGAPTLGFGFDLSLDAGHLVLAEPPIIGSSWLAVPGSDGDGLAGIAFPFALSGTDVVLASLRFSGVSLGVVTLSPGVTAGDLSEGIALDPAGFDALVFETLQITVVPEPSSALLLGTVILGLGWSRRRPRLAALCIAAVGLSAAFPMETGAQNLVPNPGFETFPGSGCSFPTGWYAINNTPEHFHSGCASTVDNVAAAASGGAWVLLRSFSGSNSNYNESIGVTLTEPLRPGCEYIASSEFATDSPFWRGGGYYKFHAAESRLTSLSEDTCVSPNPSSGLCKNGNAVVGAADKNAGEWGPNGVGFRPTGIWRHFGIEADRGWHLEVDDVSVTPTLPTPAIASFIVESADASGVIVDATGSSGEDRHYWEVCEAGPGASCGNYWSQWFEGQATRRQLPYEFRGCRTYRIKHAVQNCRTAWDEQTVEITLPGANPPPQMRAWWSGEFDTDNRVSHLHTGQWLPNAGAAKYGPARVAAGFEFDGTNCVEVPQHGQLQLFYQLSLDAWVFPVKNGGVQVVVQNLETSFYSATGYSLFLRDGELAFWLAHGMQFYEYRAGQVLPEDVWSHVAVTVDLNDPDGVRLYVNGVEASSEAPPPTLTPFGAKVHLGCGFEIGEAFPGTPGFVYVPSTPSHFVGRVDEVELFQRVLSASEIATIHGAGGFGKCADRDGLGVPSVSSFCEDRDPIEITGQLCNYGTSTNTYDLELQALPAGARSGECTVTGPNPATGEIAITTPVSINVNPRGCARIGIVAQPLARLPSGGAGVACYQLRSFNRQTGYSTAVEGTLRATTAPCPGPVDERVSAIDPRIATTGMAITLPVPGGCGSSGFLPFQISTAVVGAPSNLPALSLDGLPPGEPVTGFAPLPTGTSACFASAPVQISAALHDPTRLYELRIAIDPDGDGSFTPVGSQLVRTALPPVVCPDASDFDGDGVVSDADLALLQPSIGLSEGDAGYFAAGDLDGDGSVTLVDYQMWLGCYREWGGAPSLAVVPAVGVPLYADDRDGDGVLDAADVCPDVPDPLQQDTDGDGVGDGCDACPALNPGGGSGPDGCEPPIPLDAPECSDGIDNDLDGLTDYPDDILCTGPDDLDEASPCSDGTDNDGDGLVDYPADPECLGPGSPSEHPQCDDRIDNDGDGLVDYPEDPNCNSLTDTTEQGSTCGLGIELVLLAGLPFVRQRWSRRGGRRPAKGRIAA